MTVFDSIIGQPTSIATLKSAVRAAKNGEESQEMTHAWLFTGPPGSGRSNLAKAFAAALVCEKDGCNSCSNCLTAIAGSHPDVEIMQVEGLTIKIDEIRELLTRASWGASLGAWRIVVIEDSDRMTEAAANALLKAIEEPGLQTIWILCAPTLHDVLPTIRSRCRHISLTTPSTKCIVDYLTDECGVNQSDADLAARISLGHVGRARHFATDESNREYRNKAFQVLWSIKNEGSATQAASTLLELASERAESRLSKVQEDEEERLRNAYQGVHRGMLSGGAKALKELERDQKSRMTRATKDELDSILLDYLTFFRDALAAKSGAELINRNLIEKISDFADAVSAKRISRLTGATLRTRQFLNTNVSQLLLLESFTLEYLATVRGN